MRGEGVEKLVIGVTGATGFVGSAIIRMLSGEKGYECVALLRSAKKNMESCSHRAREIGELGDLNQSNLDLTGLDVVIHCAARVHIMDDTSLDPTAEFRRINVNGTLDLAKKCVEAGVRRFIFISSIKVNGEMTENGAAFHHNDLPAPEDAYGGSKAEAEAALRALSEETGMELVIIRPPLVYGPGVKGNFASLLRLASKGIPLPLGAVNNARSLVALDNLVDLIVRCVSHPKAAGQVFLVSDGKPVSTTDLLRGIAAAMNKRCWLLPVPEWVFRAGLGLLGKRAIADRLFGSLVVDISHTKETLDWEPPISLEEGLRRAIEPS